MACDMFVSIDLDDTLVTDNGLELVVALERLSVFAAERDIAFDRVCAQRTLDAFFTGARDRDRDYDLFIARFFERYCGDINMMIDVVSDYRNAVLCRVREHVTPLPGARATLDALDRSTIPYAILTNGWTPLQEEKARLIGFRNRVFVSERIGVRKPAPEAFAIVREHFGAAYRHIWHVGDNPRADCDGAKRVGMKTVWFNSGAKRFPSDVAAPDHIVRSHAELLELLQTRGRAP